MPGACTKVYVTEATVSLSGPDPKVTPGDINAIFAAAETNLGVLPGTLIHSSPAWFRVDGGKKTLEPVGIKGRELKAMISFVVAKASFVDDVIRRLTNMGITPKQFFSTPAGEAMLYLDEKDRDFTAVLIDVGYQTTEIMAVEGDALIFHRCIDIGGGDITAELARELNVHFPTAEKNIKQPFVYSMSATPETYEVPAQGDMPARTFTRDEVSPIVTRVVDEIAEGIRTALEESGVKLSNWSNVYLTGGGIALNRGGKDYLSSKLGRPVRETPRRSNKMSTPLFSSSMGLMNLIVDTIEQQRNADKGFMGIVRGFFRSLVGG